MSFPHICSSGRQKVEWPVLRVSDAGRVIGDGALPGGHSASLGTCLPCLLPFPGGLSLNYTGLSLFCGKSDRKLAFS